MEPGGPAAPCAGTEPVPVTGIAFLCASPGPEIDWGWHWGDRKSPKKHLDGVYVTGFVELLGRGTGN